MATIDRTKMLQDVAELNQYTVDAYIRPNNVGAITGTTANSVFKQYSEKLEDWADSTFNLLTDNSDDLQQGLKQKFVLTVDDMAGLDALVADATPIVQNGQLAVVKSNELGKSELFVHFENTWQSIYEIDDIIIRQVASSAERDALTNVKPGDIVVVTNENEVITYILTNNPVLEERWAVLAVGEINLDGYYDLASNTSDDVAPGASNLFIRKVNTIAERDALPKTTGDIVYVVQGAPTTEFNTQYGELHMYVAPYWNVLARMATNKYTVTWYTGKGREVLNSPWLYNNVTSVGPTGDYRTLNANEQSIDSLVFYINPVNDVQDTVSMLPGSTYYLGIQIHKSQLLRLSGSPLVNTYTIPSATLGLKTNVGQSYANVTEQMTWLTEVSKLNVAITVIDSADDFSNTWPDGAVIPNGSAAIIVAITNNSATSVTINEDALELTIKFD